MITRLLFERWWLLLGVLLAIELILFAVWTRRRTTLSARTAWVGLVSAAVLPVLSHFVVTPRERIEKLCRDLAAMVDSGEVSSMGSYLASEFEAADLDSEQFVSRVGDALTRVRVDHPRLSGMDVTFSGTGEAVATFNAACSIRSPEFGFRRLLSRWRLSLRESPSGWLVKSIEAVPTPLSPIRDLRDCFR